VLHPLVCGAFCVNYIIVCAFVHRDWHYCEHAVLLFSLHDVAYVDTPAVR
jgi:hypothetical protein